MQNLNFDITAGLRALASSKQKTQLLWIGFGISVILIGGVYYLRAQNQELLYRLAEKDSRVDNLQKKIDELASLYKQSRLENKELADKLTAAIREIENIKSKAI